MFLHEICTDFAQIIFQIPAAKFVQKIRSRAEKGGTSKRCTVLFLCRFLCFLFFSEDLQYLDEFPFLVF